MSELIEALQIFLKYGDVKNPIACQHDTLYIYNYAIEKMSHADIARLQQLGFDCYQDIPYFASFKYCY